MVDDASTLMPRVARQVARPDVSRVGERARLDGAELELARETPFIAVGGGEPRPLGDLAAIAAMADALGDLELALKTLEQVVASHNIHANAR